MIYIICYLHHDIGVKGMKTNVFDRIILIILMVSLKLWFSL